ncbi:MAG: SPOR domain-containing protein [Magnetococcus sp. DMHC-8]
MAPVPKPAPVPVPSSGEPGQSVRTELSARAFSASLGQEQPVSDPPERLELPPVPATPLQSTTRLSLTLAVADPVATPRASPRPAATASHRGEESREYWVKLATFSTEANAQALFQTLSALTLDGEQLPVSRSDIVNDGKNYYRVRVGPFADRAQAERAAQWVQEQAHMAGTVVFLKK